MIDTVNDIPEGQLMGIAVRAFVCKPDAPSKKEEGMPQKKRFKKKSSKPSEWVLVFDTETTTDAAQKLRFGTYQVRKCKELMESGIFYNPEALSDSEKNTLREWAENNGLALLTVQEFIEDVFYRVGYKYRATIVGLNLPFDISRLAIDHSTARASRFNKIMRGGFSFKLSENQFHPRVQIKHISSRDSFIQFAATKGQQTSRGNRKKGRFNPVRRGFFIDLKTLAAALTSRSHSLASLAKALNVPSQKHETDDHGRVLTPNYIAYAVQDTQTTWECFIKLQELFDLHGLEQTASHSIHSEASLGKAYLRDMGIKPWRELQPDFPPDLIGKIMSAYYGGRSEVHIRREIAQILYCDFLSMYPTVCTLMDLWQFVTAQSMTWQDTTKETQKFLEEITMSDLQRQETWLLLRTIVQVLPDIDIFPVRAKYDGDSQYTIGSNYLTSNEPLWYTLADCISAKLLTGRAPKILQAISFIPGEMQEGLSPVNIAGNTAYNVDPREGDFFKQIIDLRSAVKKKMKNVSAAEKSMLDSQQLALKILANSTSYGIFVELNLEEEKEPQALLCYGPSGKALPINKKKFEATGSFFHPLLAALITGAARLMLAITERRAHDIGLDWAFCDTDSMALAKPEGMGQEEFYKRAREVQQWFTPLCPYAEKEPLLKIEDYNYSLSDPKNFEALFCYAISSKRYALFNRDENGKPVLRKVSAHGLGHLIAPYHRRNEANLEDAQPWQQDLWREIINTALDDRQPNFGKLENFNMPAVSRYGATTPALEKWFSGYNQGKPYSDRVRPFNFLLAMQPKSHLKSPKPVAPYNKSPAQALAGCFDRFSGEKITKGKLKTYLESLAQYHLHPETKFLKGDFLNKGKTQRRHIIARSIQHIGKEANKWEEQFFTGFNPDAQIEYGITQEKIGEMMDIILQGISTHGTKRMAEAANLSERHVLNILNQKTSPSETMIFRLDMAVKTLDKEEEIEKGMRDRIKETMNRKNIPIRTLARELGVDASNLAKNITGDRNNAIQLRKAYAFLTGSFIDSYP